MSFSMNNILGTSNVGNVYSNYSTNSLKTIAESYNNSIDGVSDGEVENTTFDSLFQSALAMVNATNDYTNAAEEEELNYAMGLSEDTHSLMIAQEKANVSLQYTVAVRDAVIDAYKEIMNMQFQQVFQEWGIQEVEVGLFTLISWNFPDKNSREKYKYAWQCEMQIQKERTVGDV